MSDDIVTRLRNHFRGDFEKTSEFMLGQAADEIERLRKLINDSDYSCPNCECKYCLGQEGAT